MSKTPSGSSDRSTHEFAAARRTRELSWHDPKLVVELAASMSGLEYLLGVAEGRLPLPPFPDLIGVHLSSVEPGRSEFEYIPDESGANLAGILHGGLTCTLLDVAVGCAAQSQLPRGSTLATAQLNVNFIRPAHIDQPLRVIGETIRLGVNTGFCEAQMISEGDLIANATATVAIRRAAP